MARSNSTLPALATKAAALIKRDTTNLFELGAVLLDAHAQAEHGEWGPWLAKLGLSDSSADRYMAAARLKLQFPHVGNLKLTRKAIYAIAEGIEEYTEEHADSNRHHYSHYSPEAVDRILKAAKNKTINERTAYDIADAWFEEQEEAARVAKRAAAVASYRAYHDLTGCDLADDVIIELERLRGPGVYYLYNWEATKGVINAIVDAARTRHIGTDEATEIADQYAREHPEETDSYEHFGIARPEGQERVVETQVDRVMLVHAEYPHASRAYPNPTNVSPGTLRIYEERYEKLAEKLGPEIMRLISEYGGHHQHCSVDGLKALIEEREESGEETWNEVTVPVLRIEHKARYDALTVLGARLERLGCENPMKGMSPLFGTPPVAPIEPERAAVPSQEEADRRVDASLARYEASTSEYLSTSIRLIEEFNKVAISLQANVADIGDVNAVKELRSAVKKSLKLWDGVDNALKKKPRTSAELWRSEWWRVIESLKTFVNDRQALNAAVTDLATRDTDIAKVIDFLNAVARGRIDKTQVAA